MKRKGKRREQGKSELVIYGVFTWASESVGGCFVRQCLAAQVGQAEVEGRCGEIDGFIIMLRKCFAFIISLHGGVG